MLKLNDVYVRKGVVAWILHTKSDQIANNVGMGEVIAKSHKVLRTSFMVCPMRLVTNSDLWVLSVRGCVISQGGQNASCILDVLCSLSAV